MAHEIWDTDALLVVRKPAWHGLGTVLEDYPTREEAQALVHPWEPVTEEVYLQDVMLGEDGIPMESFSRAPGFKAVRRSDNADLLGIVGEGYEPVSNNELWDIAESLEQSGSDVMYETAGSLQGGRKVWALIRLKNPLVIPGDPRGETMPYYAIQNSHDGSGAFRGQAIATRIVCANTSQIADLEARKRGTEFTFRHTKNVGARVEEAQQALAGWRHSLEEYAALGEHLLDVRMTNSEIQEFLDQWIPFPAVGTSSERVMMNVEEARATWRGFLNGPTCEGIENTAFGVLQASIEYAEWGRRAFSDETRFKRSFLDRNGVVAHASKLVAAYA